MEIGEQEKEKRRFEDVEAQKAPVPAVEKRLRDAQRRLLKQQQGTQEKVRASVLKEQKARLQAKKAASLKKFKA